MKALKITDLKVGDRVFDTPFANKEEMVVVRITSTNIFFKPCDDSSYKQKGYKYNEAGEMIWPIYSQEPFHQLELSDLTISEHADKFGKIYIPSISADDSLTEMKTEKQLKDFATQFIVKWGPTAVYFNPRGAWSQRITILNEQFQESRDRYYAAKGAWCNENTSH